MRKPIARAGPGFDQISGFWIGWTGFWESKKRNGGLVEMSIQIYYFSGTGNSLHVARELEKRIPGTTLIPIIGALKNKEIATNGEMIGFIFPIYAFGLPSPVEKFLKRVDLNFTSYLFAVATRGGSPCRVFRDIDKILRKKGKSLDASLFIDMPSNYMLLPSFEEETPESLTQYETHLQQELNPLQDAITHEQKYFPEDLHKSFFKENALFPIITWIAQKTRYFGQEKKLYVDSECCSGCGICEKVCLAEKIKLENGKPTWSQKVQCSFCFACINYCPAQAIQVKRSKSPERGRYHHSAISPAEIAGQKIDLSDEK
ncbi:MAG TPA: ferredoxin [Firmicutes bacterium]|jgi:NAD-dependent dihydropyrimidine dehydrogenase PreA subunit|nr:ferredoxin [Bacillota bacterium]